MPSKSPERCLENKQETKNLRSRNVPAIQDIKIKRRRSIRDNSPVLNSEDDDIELSNIHEVNCSPSPKSNGKKLYPNLSPLRNKNSSDEETQFNFDENIPERHKTPAFQIKSSTSSNILFIALGIMCLLVLIAGYELLSKKDNDKNFKSDRNTYVDCSQFISLENKFPNQDKKLFKSLKVGIESMWNRDQSKNSVFTFFSTDQQLLNAFMKEVVKISQECINQTNDPINLSNKDLNIERFQEDNTLVINDFKEELIKRSIMIVNNVDRISSKVVPSLHAFVDTYNPLVARSILYLTVKVPHQPEEKHINYIHNHLEQQWLDLESNIREPLITRFLDQTFFLYPI